MTKIDQNEDRRNLEQLLGTRKRGLSRWAGKRMVVWLVALLIAAGGGIGYMLTRQETAELPNYKTALVHKGDMTVSVDATGTVEPTNVVEISSELSGTVRTVSVDYNDRVRKGQVLARLDVDKLDAQVAHSRATVAAAKAKVKQAEATVIESQKKYNRLRTLARKAISSQQDLEAAEATLNRAKADLDAAKADVKVAEADLSTDETNRAKADIRSPIDGVVLSRAVEPGQTVASSLQAPTLFEIAEDLRSMELQVNIDEADMGAVREGQPATFTVEAYQNRKFPAVIKELRFASETTGGVVTYKGILSIDNSQLLLRPGMTATAEITVEKVDNGLLVPNAALRWSPPATNGNDKRSLLQSIMPRPPRQRTVAKTETKDGLRRIWLLQNGEPTAVDIRTGASNGIDTLVLEGKLKDGDRIITDTLDSKR